MGMRFESVMHETSFLALKFQVGECNFLVLRALVWRTAGQTLQTGMIAEG